MSSIKILLVLIIFSTVVCGSEISATIIVNGDNPRLEGVVLDPSGSNEIIFDVVCNENIILSDIDFISTPSFLGAALNAWMEDNSDLPKKCVGGIYDKSFELPSVVPSGDYLLSTNLIYTGDKVGNQKEDYFFSIPTDSMVSGTLRFLVDILPDNISNFIAKKLI